MQGWLQWLIYALAVIGALVITCLIGTLIVVVVSVIRDKIGDYRKEHLEYKDFYFKYKRNYLKYEDYYLTHKGNEDTFEKESIYFILKLDTGKEYAFEIGYNLENYTISGGCLYDVTGTYLGEIEKIRIWGKNR